MNVRRIQTFAILMPRVEILMAPISVYVIQDSEHIITGGTGPGYHVRTVASYTVPYYTLYS